MASGLLYSLESRLEAGLLRLLGGAELVGALGIHSPSVSRFTNGHLRTFFKELSAREELRIGEMERSGAGWFAWGKWAA